MSGVAAVIRVPLVAIVVVDVILKFCSQDPGLESSKKARGGICSQADCQMIFEVIRARKQCAATAVEEGLRLSRALKRPAKLFSGTTPDMFRSSI